MRRALICLMLLSALPLTAIAQNARLEFEVASVKRNETRSGSAINGMIQGDRFTSTNVTVSQLVRAAYGIQEYQIAEQPGWFDSERFDIQAKFSAGADPKNWQPMLQSLLADRFKLAFHRVSKDVSMYALVVAKSGHKLKSADPAKCDRSKQPGDCGGFRASNAEIIGTSVSMPQLATRLSRSLGRQVVDKTDLNGEFDLTVQWTPDEAVPLGPGASAGPAIFAAIQEQLGLRLESTKGPVETLLIDRVERPSEN